MKKKKILKRITKVKVGGLIYKIKYVHPHVIDGDCGKFDANNLTILINESLSLEMQRTTILHEIIEAINYNYELNLKHNKITTLESTFFQILKENKQLFNELLQ